MNRPFPSCLLRLNPRANPFLISYKTFIFSCKSNSVSFVRFCARSRFETEPQGNSKILHVMFECIISPVEQIFSNICLGGTIFANHGKLRKYGLHKLSTAQNFVSRGSLFQALGSTAKKGERKKRIIGTCATSPIFPWPFLLRH